jgi:carbamate kinase
MSVDFKFEGKPLPRSMLRNDAVRALLHSRAVAIAGMVPGGGILVADESGRGKGRTRARSAVITYSMRARYRERKRKTLTRALRGARRGLP